MSWQLASFLILAAVLAGGFAWYERSRPPARVLALVASLAALAVVGRIAFVAFPNVKPTTDIVLFAGYALGGVPGFAVGAVTALVSNIVLLQGPWTPWQMAAWGGVGLAGGGLARVARGRELGRFTLAAACGLAGLAFGAVMDAYQWTLAAEQDLGSYVAVSASSLSFNVAHAVGNVVFCLAIGPPFVRALRRYRRRFEVRWPAPATATIAAGLGALVAGLAASAPPALGASAEARALAYLERAQNADGGFGPAPGASSSQLHTGWAALGLAAAGRNPSDVQRDGRSALDYIGSQASQLGDTGELERTILVLAAARNSPRSFAGRDLVAELLRRRKADGSFEGQVNWTAFGIFALRAAGERPGAPRIRASGRWLERQQNADGGFGFGRRGSASSVDNTAAALQALRVAGRERERAARRALAYVRGAQNPDGGFGQMPRDSSNAQSTSWAVQGVIAARRNPERLRRGSRTPLAYLRSLQGADGSIRYSRTSEQTPVWVTAQALTALERKPFPFASVPRARAGRSDRGAAAARRGAEPKARRRAAPGKRRGRATTPSQQVSPDGASREVRAIAARRARAEVAESDGPRRLLWAGLAGAGALLASGWWWLRRRRGGAEARAGT